MILPIMASADDSGTCGNGVTYSFVESTQTLSISGSGAISDYNNVDAPWHEYSHKIVRILIGEGITSIGKHAFINCKNLNSVTIPNTVSLIGFESFYGCSSLASIDLPNSIENIDENAFASSGLTSIIIPSGVTSIKTNTFSCCTNLNSVTIPYGVISIGDRAFDSCENLPTINIPSSVTSIGESAFQFCHRMTWAVMRLRVPRLRGRPLRPRDWSCDWSNVTGQTSCIQFSSVFLSCFVFFSYLCQQKEN